jgi:hypothetical protein
LPQYSNPYSNLLWAGQLRGWSSSPDRVKNLTSLCCLVWLCGPQHPISTGSTIPGDKEAEV